MKKLIPILFILVLIVAGCGGINNPVQQNSITSGAKGLVQLNIAATLSGKTITPNVDMTVAYYNITGNGEDGVNFTRNNVTDKNVLLDNLAPGPWSIIVDAYNKDNIKIASGFTNVDVLENDTVNATVTVRPLTGTGTLHITMDWSNYPLPNPVIEATLTPKDGSASPITFNITGNTAEYTGTWDAGYYTLVVLLNNGTSFKWGAAEAVRILEGQISEGHYDIEIPLGLGDINLTIIDELQNPISVGFTGQLDYITPGTDMTITATTSEPVDSYQWFIDGHPISGATSATITYGSALPRGKHRFDLIVTKNVSANSIVSSGTVKFTVSATGEHNTWVSKPNIHVPQYGMSAVSWNGKIYSFGGWVNGTEVEVYDPVFNTWTEKTPIPISTCEPTAVVFNDLIYVIGGYIYPTGLTAVQVYNPATDTWLPESGSNMVYGRAGAAAAVANGTIYVFGGYNAGPVTNTMEEYNPVTNTWTEKTVTMNLPRWRVSAVTINDKIYIFGGGTDAWASPTNSVIIYDPLDDSFSAGPDMPYAISSYGIGTYNGKVYIMGGISTSTMGITGEVFEFNPATNQWAGKASMPTPRIVFGATELNGKIYAIGGSGDSTGVTLLNSVDAYTP